MMEGKRVILSSTATFPEELVKDALIFELGKHTKLNRIIERIQKEFEVGLIINECCYIYVNFQLNVIRRIIISGSGDESRKCVSCVEALKKALSNQNLYQWNLLRVKDNVNLLGAALSFKPEISIMISRDPFPETYQSHRYLTL